METMKENVEGSKANKEGPWQLALVPWLNVTALNAQDGTEMRTC
jgi:hypothetical protein